jgi:hypothetical protein
VSQEATLYERLGVAPGADLASLRAAYHQRARELHPDVVGSTGPDAQLRMALVNEAWAVLSDPGSRASYDLTLRPPAPGHSSGGRGAGPTVVVRPAPPRPAPQPVRVVGRKEAWLVSMRVQIRRLGTQAARSAAQSLLLRHHGVARELYEAEIPPIVDHLLGDTEARVREARIAGAAPLDLANGAALLGLWSLAHRLVAERPPSESTVRRAEMVDRMFDIVAHELPRGLVRALGDNPRVGRRLTGRR